MKKILFFIIAFLLVFPITFAHAANVGDRVNFNVDPVYDASERSQVPASLIKIASSLYFYIETGWWDAQTPAKQSEVLANLDNLSAEFNNKIYPTLTSLFGSEARPGIDNDNKISILFESMGNNLGGYFRSNDEYSKLQSPSSNEREMIYLPTDRLQGDQLKVFLAHEFVHLIVFNQKEKLQGTLDETWLSEARADYASTILGYDNVYQGSNLQNRVKDFFSQPSDSLTEWRGTRADYAVTNLFMHYLVDHYGINVLTDSLHSRLAGIPSINAALLKAGAKEDFGRIFTAWTVAIAVNNCASDARYCYLNENLTDVKVNPNLIFLPLVGESALTTNNMTKSWTGNWQKIIGGNGDLKLKFEGFSGLDFEVPYIIYDKNNDYTIRFLALDSAQKGEINIKNFGTSYNALLMIPSLQSKVTGLGGPQLSYPYTFTISITGAALSENEALVEQLLGQIESLKKQIAVLQGNAGGAPNANCLALNSNLYAGVLNNSQVSCLQQFLKAQGSDIYPQGLVTGTFGSLTKIAVIRFQRKYNILQTGFVGPMTRQKINQLITK